MSASINAVTDERTATDERAAGFTPDASAGVLKGVRRSTPLLKDDERKAVAR
jgi:hypothetical protein